MTAVTADRPPRRSLLGMVIVALNQRSRRRSNQPSRLAAAIRDHAMTFGAMAAVDVGMFHLGFVPGWVAVGASLILADFKIQG